MNKEIQTYEYFLQEQLNYQNRPVYITEKVVEGFKAQGQDISSHLTKAAVFELNKLFDPVCYTAELYYINGQVKGNKFICEKKSSFTHITDVQIIVYITFYVQI